MMVKKPTRKKKAQGISDVAATLATITQWDDRLPTLTLTQAKLLLKCLKTICMDSEAYDNVVDYLVG